MEGHVLVEHVHRSMINILSWFFYVNLETDRKIESARTFASLARFSYVFNVVRKS